MEVGELGVELLMWCMEADEEVGSCRCCGCGGSVMGMEEGWMSYGLEVYKVWVELGFVRLRWVTLRLR